MRYTIKGRAGDTREVKDSQGILIGYIHRNEKDAIHWRGSSKSITISKRTVVYWTATFPDGRSVLWIGTRKRKSMSYMREWTRPEAWDLSEAGEEKAA